MALSYLLLLALIQGLTEFLPVSSSGHLVLTHSIMGNATLDLCWTENRMLDVSVHVGTLFAVMTYFYKDLWQIAAHLHQPKSESFLLFKNVIIASIPVIIAGYIIHTLEPSFICLLEIMAWMTVIFGIVLWIADRYGKTENTLTKMTIPHAFMIGLAQCIALIPGVSRSGITMTAARFIGFSRVEAARFSLLLSIIAIGGAGVLSGYDLYQSGDFALGLSSLMAIGLAFVTGLAAIAVMMKWLQKYSFTPFAIYRIILGSILLAIIYF